MKGNVRKKYSWLKFNRDFFPTYIIDLYECLRWDQVIVYCAIFAYLEWIQLERRKTGFHHNPWDLNINLLCVYSDY